MAVDARVPPMTAIAADPFPGKAVVLFDGECRYCQKSVRILRGLDWLGRLAFQSGRETDRLPPSAEPLDPQRLIEEMHIVTPDRRRVHVGFGAFRWMAWRLPLTLPIAPLLYLPGVPWLGNRVYRWVAKNRFDLVPCHDGACQVPLKRKA